MLNLQIQEKYFASFALSLDCETFPFEKRSLISKLAIMIHIIGNAPALQKLFPKQTLQIYETWVFTVSQLHTFPWSVMDWQSEEFFDTTIRSEIMGKTGPITYDMNYWILFTLSYISS